MYRQIRCTQCGRYVPCGNYQVHLASECPMRPAVCQHCGNRVPNDQLEVSVVFIVRLPLPLSLPNFRQNLPQQQHISCAQNQLNVFFSFLNLS